MNDPRPSLAPHAVFDPFARAERLSTPLIHQAWFCVIVIAALLAHGRSLWGGMVWDDYDYIANNGALRSLAGLFAIWFDPQACPQYYPLTFTTFWFEFHLWGLWPVGYHTVNLVLHVANALLVWRILDRLMLPAAPVAALLFAVHPVHVETVAWISERKNLLSAFFYLLTTRLWLDETFRRSSRGVALITLSFIAALASKSVTLTWPLIAALLNGFGEPRTSIRAESAVPGILHPAVTRRWERPWLGALLILGIAAGLRTVWLEVHLVGGSGEEWNRSLLERLRLMGTTLWFYPLKLLWPKPLIFMYPQWSLAAHCVLPWVALIAALAAPVAALCLRRRLGRGPLIALCGYGLTIAPATGLFNLYPMRYSFVQDHFQYLASIFILALFASVFQRFWTVAFPWVWMTGRHGAAPAEGRRHSARRNAECHMGFAGTVGVVVAVLILLSIRRSADFMSEEALWRSTIAKNPGAWAAWNNLGSLLLERGDAPAAVESFTMALRLRPAHVEARSNLGNAFRAMRDYPAACQAFEEALALQPDFPKAHMNFGLLLLDMGRKEEALAHFREALRLDPELAAAAFNVGVLLFESGRPDEAVLCFEQATRAAPNYVEAWFNLGVACRAAGQSEKAREALERVLRIRPDMAAAHEELARLYVAELDAPRARWHAAQALRISGRIAADLAVLLQPPSALNP